MVAFLLAVHRAMIPENVHSSSPENQRQYNVVVSLILIASLFLVILGVVTFFQGVKILSVVDFGIASLFIGLGIFLKRTSKIREVGTVIVLFLAVYFFYLFHYSGLERSTWVWYYTFPLWSILLLGKRTGTALSLGLILVTLSTYLFLLHATSVEMYSSNLMARFILSYVCVTFITFVMEEARIGTYRKLLKTNSELNQAIEELKDTRMQLSQLTTHDSITELNNARYFYEILRLSIAHANKYKGTIALSLIDIDFSNNFISYYSQKEFDDILPQIVKTMYPIVYCESDSLCRLEGSRFGLILNNVKPDQVEHLAQAINKAISGLNIRHERSPYKIVTVSVGSVVIPEVNSQFNSSEILQHAERALARAVEKGKNSVATSLYTVSERQ